MSRVYTTGEFAKFFRVEINSVLRWIKKGYIKAHYTKGGHARITEEELSRVLEEWTTPCTYNVDEETKLTPEEVATASEIAEMFGLTEERVLHLAREKRIRSFKTLGGHYRFEIMKAFVDLNEVE